jgi:RNA polymerase sigma-70 factor (ECF subfamily)
MISDEAHLITLAVAGDAVAVQLLLVHHHAALVADIERRLPAHLARVLSAEDICQEAYVAAVRRLAQFQAAGEGSFFAWLRTIAEHKLMDAIRAAGAAKRGPRNRLIEPVGGEATSMVALLDLLAVDERTPSQSMARREVVQHVQSALERLETDHREVLRLRYVKGQSVGEVARQMGRSEGAVKMLCSRALKQLCEQLGDLSRFVTQAWDVRQDPSKG